MYTITMTNYYRNPEWNKKYKDSLFFGGNREKAILRDKEMCVKCHMTRAEHIAKYDRDITVDHINKLGTHVRRDKRDNRMENLQTLCLSCHASKDAKLQWLSVKKFSWSKEYKCCKSCKSTAKRHQGKGLCRTCYGRIYASVLKRKA